MSTYIEIIRKILIINMIAILLLIIWNSYLTKELNETKKAIVPCISDTNIVETWELKELPELPKI